MYLSGIVYIIFTATAHKTFPFRNRPKQAVLTEEVLLSLKEFSISPALLNDGTINLLVARANRTWKDTDQKAYEELKANLSPEKRKSLFFYLTQADRNAVEEFTGQLPPYTVFKNFIYRISQLGLTAVENTHAK